MIHKFNCARCIFYGFDAERNVCIEIIRWIYCRVCVVLVRIWFSYPFIHSLAIEKKKKQKNNKLILFFRRFYCYDKVQWAAICHIPLMYSVVPMGIETEFIKYLFYHLMPSIWDKMENKKKNSRRKICFIKYIGNKFRLGVGGRTLNMAKWKQRKCPWYLCWLLTRGRYTCICIMLWSHRFEIHIKFVSYPITIREKHRDSCRTHIVDHFDFYFIFVHFSIHIKHHTWCVNAKVKQKKNE